MKKIVRYLMLAVLTLCFSLPCLSISEAASVALLPLINNVEGDDLLSQLFYNQAFAVFRENKGFTLIEDKQLQAAINKYTVPGKLPEEMQLRRIAAEGNVDIVIAVQIDVLEDSINTDGGEDRTLKLDLQGRTVAFNRLANKYYSHRIFDDKVISEALTSRWDWVHDEFSRNMRLEMTRAIKAK